MVPSRIRFTWDNGSNPRRLSDDNDLGTYYIRSPKPALHHWYQDSYWKYQPHASDPLIFLRTHPITVQPLDGLPVTVAVLDDQLLRLSLSYSTEQRPVEQPRIFYDFDHYVTTLPPWEETILSGVTLFTTPDEIVQHLRQPACTAQLVSDGSQQQASMSFGWILGLHDGTPLAEHSGPAYGQPSSHRAEGWGMLSGARFLLHLQRYCNVTVPLECNVETICDNAGLISRMNNRQNYNHSYANSTLAPDWDLTEQIHSTHVELSLPNNSFVWEKGHQDEQTPAHLLSVAAKYNIRADKLAEDYMATYPLERLITPLLPATSCQLLISGKSVDSHYHYRIRLHAAELDFYDYLKAKHHWSQSTLDDINWIAFRSAARTFESTDTHLLKLLHGKLPTRKHKSRFELHVSPKCHYCSDDETFEHLVRCQNPISNQFRTNIIRKIRAYCSQHHLPAKFTTVIATAANDWTHNRDPLLSTPVPQSAHGCIRSQTQIGWWHFLLGFQSTSWQNLLVTTSRRSAQAVEPSAIMSGLLKTMWTSLSEFWTAHLTHIHRSNQSSINDTSVDQVAEYKAKIRLLHERRHECQAAHQDRYFHPDVEQFLSISTGYQLRSYILHYETSIHASIRARLQAQTTTLFHFPGFHRPLRNATTAPAPIPDSEEPPHHNHTRWRQALMTVFPTLSRTRRPSHP